MPPPPVHGPSPGLCAPFPAPAPSWGTRRILNHHGAPLGEGKLNPVPAARGQGWECECGNRSRLRMTSRTEGRCWAARDLIQLGPAPIKMRSRRMGRGKKRRYLCVSVSTAARSVGAGLRAGLLCPLPTSVQGGWCGPGSHPASKEWCWGGQGGRGCTHGERGESEL